MTLRNTPTSWGWLARLLHWVMAVLIAGMLGFGLYLTQGFNDGDPAKLGLVQSHKSFGFVVFCLAACRILWRAVNPTPALPEGMSGAMRLAAHGGHLALYVLMIALPVTGWLMASASPFNDPDAYPMQIRNMVFGLFEMPDPYPAGDAALSKWFGRLHEACALALAGLLTVHVAAALKHHLINRDGVLVRMLKG